MEGERGLEGLQSPRSNARVEDGTWARGLPTMDSRAHAFDDGGGVGGALKNPLPAVDQAAKVTSRGSDIKEPVRISSRLFSEVVIITKSGII